MGAAGGIGQPMSLLLKQSSVVTQLALYDIVGTPGVAADLSHIETQSQVGLAYSTLHSRSFLSYVIGALCFVWWFVCVFYLCG